MHSNLYKLYYNLGHVLHQQGDWLGAADCYRQVIALKPEYASAHHNLGAVLDEQGRRAAAIASYQRAIALQPDHINAHNNLGGALLKQGQVDAAIQVYRQAIALQPDWAILHHHLGQALHAQGDIDGAIAAYRHAISLQPDRSAAHYSLGKLLYQQQHYSAAVDCFKTVVQLEPDHNMVLGDLASCFLALGKWNEVIFWSNRAIAQFPQQRQFVEAFCQWADGLAAQTSDLSNDLSDLDEWTQTKLACSRFLKTLLRSPDDSTLYHHLAQTYIHMGNMLMAYGGVQQYQQAEGVYQKALQLTPNAVDLYLRLGHSLTRQNRIEAAIALYHLTLAKYPADHNLRLALEKAWSVGQDGENGANGSAIAPAMRTPQPSWQIYRTTWDWFQSANIDSRHYIPLPSHLQSPIPPSPLSSSPSSPPNIQPPTPNTPPPCPGLNCLPCLQKILSQFEPVQLEQGVYGCTGNPSLADGALPTFVATIPQGRTWVVPQQNSWMVCNAIATLTADGALLADLSREYPGQLPGCQQGERMHHRLLEQDTLPPLTQLDATVAVLAGLSGNTYYHWMIDVLPRLELLRRSGIKVAEIDWFLVNNNRPGFQQETLERLGIPSAKILPSDRYPHVQAKQLIVPSFPGYLGWPQPWALEFLRRKFLSLDTVELKQNYPQNIYITRANAHYRRVLNEPDVIKYLHTFGFEAIALESLSFQQQVALFSQANIIISPHGSGLTNTIFSKPGTKVVELVSPHYIRHYYWLISQYLGLSHYYVSGELFSCYPIRELMYQNPLTEDIWISQNSLQRMMKLLS